MPFNSLKYFLFLPVVYLVFYFVGERARWCVLLAASLLFYAALSVPYLLVVLVLVAITTYGFAIWLERAESAKAKQTLLWGSIATNILILAAMKYLPFLSENLRALSTILSLDAHIQPIKAFVAIGVSYYIFQAISYLIDIYLEIEKPERHFGYFILYLAFFPKLLQGPIERAGDLIPQLKKPYTFNYDAVRSGLLLFTWGLFKKVVIADRLALYADQVFNNVHDYTGLSLIIGIYAYALQIYFDFSAYTDMARGTGRLFGINLTENFNSPYLATSLADFWRRWHISFSRWILDYIFKPLQMQWRNGKNVGTAAALIITFLVSGIWHGANWGFVVWGLLHGIYLACSVFYRPYQKRLHKYLGIEKTRFLTIWQICVTFNLVSFAWIFFRTANIEDAMYVVSNMFYGMKGLSSKFLLSQDRPNTLTLAITLVMFAVVAMCINRYQQTYQNNAIFRWTVYYVLVLSIVLLAVKSKSTFIYFGF